MQAVFSGNEALANALAGTISKPRLHRYIQEANGDKAYALALYHWNIELAQSMYLPIQVWEVTLRNRLNSFLTKQYGPRWPYDNVRAVRQFTHTDKDKLARAKRRQEKNRSVVTAPTPAIVADLSASFWVSLLSTSYEVPFVWRSQIGRIFPYDAALDRATAYALCSDLLDLRNRVAHHEAVYHLPLAQRRTDAERLIKAMCSGATAHLTAKCQLASVLSARPTVRFSN